MINESVKLAPSKQKWCEIENEINSVIHSRTDRAKKYGSWFADLWQLTSEFVIGGKLIRPKLLLGAYDAFSNEETQDSDLRASALELAAGLELLHFAFLLHDDVIDEDLLRRGKPNLVGHLATLKKVDKAKDDKAKDDKANIEPDALSASRQLHWARSSSILVGDLMLTIAHQIFAKVRLPEDMRIKILDLLDDTVNETVAGEFYDVSLGDDRITPDLNLVLHMTRMKTAAYTFELPLRIACVIAGTDDHQEEIMGDVGRHIGLAFQLQDDLLSAFGTTEAHGKDQFSDFRERKETVLMAYARTTDSWPKCDQLLEGTEFNDDSGRDIQRILIDCGARQFVESLIDDQIFAALKLLTDDKSKIPSDVSRFILKFVDALESRKQ